MSEIKMSAGLMSEDNLRKAFQQAKQNYDKLDEETKNRYRLYSPASVRYGLLREYLDTFPTEYPMLCNYGTPVKRMTRPLIGRERQMRQLKAGLLRPELCNVLLLGDAGSGKSCADGTPVPVFGKGSVGYKAIQDIKVGDFVFDEKGKPTEVLGVYPQGKKRAYEVTFADGSSIICNDEHLWNVRTRKQHLTGRPYKTMTLREMINYGIVRKLVAGNMKSFYIPMNNALEREEAELPVDPYVLGVLIGDGNLASNSAVAISSNEEDIIAKVACRLGAADYVQMEHNYDWLFYKAGVKKTSNNKYIQQKELADKCDFDGVFYTKSIDKNIPDIYKFASINQRWELVRGLMDTDGTISGNDRCNLSFSTNSKRLAEDFQEVVRSLGYRATITNQERNDEIHKNIEYEVHISCTDADKYKFVTSKKHVSKLDTYKRDERHFNKIYDDLAIVNVRDLGYETDMTCLYVAAPSHLFQVGKEHIVTHNTALVQGSMASDIKRVYLEIDISKMIADLRDNNEMAVKVKALFDESARFVKQFHMEIVLFIDEFHLICMLSDAAVEALKPMLADSGTRGVRVIVATTFTEFRQYVSANQPLVQRLQRIEVLPPGKETVVQILRSYSEIYGVSDMIRGTHLFEQIYELSNKYIPANSQPRKSILLLDMMVGWYRSEPNMKFDMKLLYDVLKYSEGIELNVRVDAVGIKKRLDEKVFAQYLATSAVAARLQITSADLNNKTKPMSSFLFTGSTGVGKSLPNDVNVPVWDANGGVYTKKNGDLKKGDFVYNQAGKPVEVIEVFPQKEQLDVYEVIFSDGRSLKCSGEHIWAYKSRFGNGAKKWHEATTEEIYDKLRREGSNPASIRYVIPMNGPVERKAAIHKIPAYAMGVLISHGFVKDDQLIIKLNDKRDIDIAEKTARLIGADGIHFRDVTDRNNNRLKRRVYNADLYESMYVENSDNTPFLAADIHRLVPDVITEHMNERYIPDEYKNGSIEQRYELIRGLFDPKAVVNLNVHRKCEFYYETTSERLATDVRYILFSLGIPNRIGIVNQFNKPSVYKISILLSNEKKAELFGVDRKRKHLTDILKDVSNKYIREYDYQVGIKEIRKLDEKTDMTCILVDDEDHLYQAGEFVVTHNTELTKQLAEILFSDPKRLIRFDMTEYSQPQSIERFRVEVTSKVWERPYSVLLFDEIEKACGDVTRILLQVLDDGRLIDQNNREVSFLNTYIVLTTNAASEIYATIGDYMNASGASDEEQIKTLQKYMKVIRRAIVEGTGQNKFPPELLGRIDCICPFMPLSDDTQRKILIKRMDKLQEEVMVKHELKVTYATDDILKYILYDKLDTESNSGGARIVATKFEEEVVIEVARIINVIEQSDDPDIKRESIEGIIVKIDGEMAADNENLLEGDAHVVAYPVTRDNRIIYNKKGS